MEALVAKLARYEELLEIKIKFQKLKCIACLRPSLASLKLEHRDTLVIYDMNGNDIGKPMFYQESKDFCLKCLNKTLALNCKEQEKLN